MTLNGVIAFILRYFTEFDSFAGRYVTVVEDRLIMSAKCRLAKTDPRSGRAVSLQQLSFLLLFTLLMILTLMMTMVIIIITYGQPFC